MQPSPIGMFQKLTKKLLAKIVDLKHTYYVFLTSNLTKEIMYCALSRSLPTLCDPMDCSTPGFPILHQLPELAQTHIHRVGDATQPSHPLSSPSPAFNLSQNQGLFQRVSSLHQVAKYWSFSFNIRPSNEHQV